MSETDPTSLDDAIMRYFEHNPKTAETLEGLSQWRLEEERVARTVQDVQVALERLLVKGFLVAERHGSRTIFRLNPEHPAESERTSGAAVKPVQRNTGKN